MMAVFRAQQINAAPDVKMAVANVVVPISTPGTRINPSSPDFDPPGTLEINLPTGFGIPKAVIVVMSGGRDEQAAYNNASMSVGFSDGTNDRVAYAMYDSEDGGPTQDCFRTIFDSNCILRIQGSGGASDVVDNVRHALSVREFQTDKVVFDINILFDFDNHTREGYLIAIGGDDVESVAVGTHDDLDTSNNISIGFEPDMLWGAMIASSSILTNHGDTTYSRFNNAELSWGVAINTPTIKQMGMSWFSANGQNPAENTLGLYNDSIFAKLNDGAQEVWVAPLTAFTATGVTFTPSTTTNNSLLVYLAIKFANTVNMDIVDFSIPTVGALSVASTVNNPGFGLMQAIDNVGAYNTPIDTSFSMAHMAFDRNSMRTVNLTGKDGVSNSDLAGWAREDQNLVMMDADLNASTIDVQSSGYTIVNTDVNITLTNYPANPILSRMLLMGVN